MPAALGAAERKSSPLRVAGLSQERRQRTGWQGWDTGAPLMGSHAGG